MCRWLVGADGWRVGRLVDAGAEGWVGWHADVAMGWCAA